MVYVVDGMDGHIETEEPFVSLFETSLIDC